MTATYEKLGVRFLYPENWQITDEDAVSWPRTVSVQSPSGGFWSLMIYRGHDKDPSELTEEVLATMRQEYEGLEASPVSQQIDGAEMAGYDMFFYCLDFVVSARVLGFHDADRTLLMIWQAEDREFENMVPVFRAIATSLLQDWAAGQR